MEKNKLKTVIIRKNKSNYYGWSTNKKELLGVTNANHCILAKYLGRPVLAVTAELKKLHYKTLHLTSKEFTDYLQMIDNFDKDVANEQDIEVLKQMKSKLKMRLLIK